MMILGAAVKKVPFALTIFDRGTSTCMPEDSIGWEFETDGDTEGWRNGRSLSDTTTREGILIAHISGGDPYWWGPEAVSIEAEAYPNLEVRYRIEAPESDNIAQFMWTNAIDPDQTYIEFPIATDGTWQTANVNLLTENFKWFDNIIRLRFDPVRLSPAGGIVEIDYIRLCGG